MPNRLELGIGTLELSVTPTIDAPLRADYLPDSREVVLSTDFHEPFVFPHGDDLIVLDIQQVDLRLSEEAIRQLLALLPPEMLH